MKLRLLYVEYSGSYDFNMYILNSIGCSRRLLGFNFEPGNILEISFSGKLDRIVRYCNEEYSVLRVSDDVNFVDVDDIKNRHDDELNELLGKFSGDMNLLRNALSELEKKYQTIAWF